MTESTTKNLCTGLTLREVDILGEIGNIIIGTSATTLHDIISKQVSITSPQVCVNKMMDLGDVFSEDVVVIHVAFTDGFEGNTLMLLEKSDVRKIAGFFMDESCFDFGDEWIIGVVVEAMNQMIGSASTALSEMLHTRINITSPRAVISPMSGSDLTRIIKAEDDIIQISFKMQIEEAMESEIIQIMPVTFGKWLAENIEVLTV